MMKLALVFLAALALGVDGQTPNYTGLCRDHTMVKYQPVGPACAPLISSGVSAAEAATIVTAHNDLRSRVAFGYEKTGLPGPQPPAANMLKLMWDAELATVAQQWASQCIFAHDVCRKVPRFSNVGQNIYASFSASNENTANWNESINAWYKQVYTYNRANVNPYVFSPATGFYTQVVWANTSLVGCGYSFYKNDGSPFYRKLTVCNYAPGGNTIGRSMYLIGAACSQCPKGTACVSGLCV